MLVAPDQSPRPGGLVHRPSRFPTPIERTELIERAPREAATLFYGARPAALRGRAGLDSGGWCSGALFCAPVHGFRCISLYALHRKTATTAGLDSASSAPALCTTTLHHHMHHHMHQQAHDAGMNKSQLYLEALRAPPHAPPHAPAGAGPPSISEGALTANLPTVLGAQGDFCLVDLGDPSQERAGRRDHGTRKVSSSSTGWLRRWRRSMRY